MMIKGTKKKSNKQLAKESNVAEQKRMAESRAMQHKWDKK